MGNKTPQYSTTVPSTAVVYTVRAVGNYRYYIPVPGTCLQVALILLKKKQCDAGQALKENKYRKSSTLPLNQQYHDF